MIYRAKQHFVSFNKHIICLFSKRVRVNISQRNNIKYNIKYIWEILIFNIKLEKHVSESQKVFSILT